MVVYAAVVRSRWQSITDVWAGSRCKNAEWKFAGYLKLPGPNTVDLQQVPCTSAWRTRDRKWWRNARKKSSLVESVGVDCRMRRGRCDGWRQWRSWLITLVLRTTILKPNFYLAQHSIDFCPLTKTDYTVGFDFAVIRFLMKLFCIMTYHIISYHIMSQTLNDRSISKLEQTSLS